MLDRSPFSSEDREKLPVLIILHQETSTPGRVGDSLRAKGYRLDIRRPRFGEPLPRTLSAHSGAVIFGGPMSANDPDDYVKAEIDWLAVPLAEKKPFLGICLGAQMLVKHLGGTVSKHSEGLVEIGYYPISATEAGLSLIEQWPTAVYQWHREGFDLPAGADLLASGSAFTNQALQVGPAAFGIQFHPEVTYAMMNRWTTKAHDMLSMPGARPAREHMLHHARYDGGLKRWLDQFLVRWLNSSAS